MKLTKENVDTFNKENKINQLKDLTNIVTKIQDNIDTIKHDKADNNSPTKNLKEAVLQKEKNFIKQNYKKA